MPFLNLLRWVCVDDRLFVFIRLDFTKSRCQKEGNIEYYDPDILSWEEIDMPLAMLSEGPLKRITRWFSMRIFKAEEYSARSHKRPGCDNKCAVM